MNREPLTIIIVPPAKMLTMNNERRLHWSTRAERTRMWREAAYVMAKDYKIPEMDTVEIDAYITQRGVLADAGAHAPTIKAIVDGLVDAKMIPNDDPSHLRALRIHPPERGEPQIRLVIT